MVDGQDFPEGAIDIPGEIDDATAPNRAGRARRPRFWVLVGRPSPSAESGYDGISVERRFGNSAEGATARR